MNETWSKSPSNRLPILRVKKTLQKAIDQVQFNPILYSVKLYFFVPCVGSVDHDS